MALSGSKQFRSRRLVDIVRERLKDWRAGEHALTQRMAGAAFVIRMASAAIMFVSQILLARWMGGYEFGNYVYVWTWLLLLGELVHLGLPLTAQRFVPEYTQAGALDLLRGYLMGSRLLTLGAATALAIIGALIATAAAPSLDNAAVMPLYLACIALPFYAFTFMIDGLARSYNWIYLALLPPFVARPLLFVILAACLHAAGIALDATTVMGLMAGLIWLTALIQLLQLQHRLRQAVAAGAKAYDVRKWLGISLPIVLVWGLYTLLNSADVLILKQFRPAVDVAHYYAAAKTLALVGIIQFAVAAVVAHRFTAYHFAGDRDALITFAAATVRWVFWPSLAVTLLILALGWPILMLFGQDFVAGYPVLAILALGQLARAAVGPAERLLNMLDQQRACALVYAAACTVGIAGSFVLAPHYGAIGVAVATAMAFATEALLLFVVTRRRLGLHMFFWTRDRG